MNSAIKKITGGFTALFLSFGLALSYPVQALELRFVLPSPDFSKEQKKDQGQILKFELVQEQEEENQVVKIDLVVKDKKSEKAEKPEKPVKAQPQIIILKFQLPKELTDEKLQELQKQIVKLKEAIAKLTPQPKAGATALNDINGLKLPIVQAVVFDVCFVASAINPSKSYTVDAKYTDSKNPEATTELKMVLTKADELEEITLATLQSNTNVRMSVPAALTVLARAVQFGIGCLPGHLTSSLPGGAAPPPGAVTGTGILAIDTASLPDANRTDPYSQTLSASGGVTPYTWSISSGALPAGLSLSTAGVISGTVTASNATYTFTVQVTDNNAIRNRELSIVVTGSG